MTQDIFTIATGADDGRVTKETNGVYPPTGTAVVWTTESDFYVVRDVTGGIYRIFNGLLQWDTSALPNATIDSAYLRINVPVRDSADGLSLVGDWFQWSASETDYSAAPLTSAFGAVSVLSLPSAADVDIALSGLTNISLTGRTYMRLHLTQRASDAAPTGLNYVGVRSYEASTTLAARLVVNYTAVTPVRVAPDAIIAQTNLSGALSTIQDDPDSPDGNWLVAP